MVYPTVHFLYGEAKAGRCVSMTPKDMHIGSNHNRRKRAQKVGISAFTPVLFVQSRRIMQSESNSTHASASALTLIADVQRHADSGPSLVFACAI